MRSQRMGNTGMYVNCAVLVFLIGCHSSSPSLSPGSGSGETAGMAGPTAGAPAPRAAPQTAPQQNEAPATADHLPATTPQPAGKGPRPSPAGGAVSVDGTAKAGGAAAGPGIEQACGPGDACAAGLTCIHYYGIAGTNGPEFKSCEIRCKDSSACPKGWNCVTVSDGPGQVCRQ